MCYVKILIWAIEIQVPKTKYFQNHKEAIKSKMSGIVVTVKSFFWFPGQYTLFWKNEIFFLVYIFCQMRFFGQKFWDLFQSILFLDIHLFRQKKLSVMIFFSKFVCQNFWLSFLLKIFLHKKLISRPNTFGKQ